MNHIAGSKLGIVDYLSRDPSPAAPNVSSFDEQFVVKFFQKFFEACDTLENLVKKELLTDQKSDQYLQVSAIFSSYREIQPNLENHINYLNQSNRDTFQVTIAQEVAKISAPYFNNLNDLFYNSPTLEGNRILSKILNQSDSKFYLRKNPREGVKFVTNCFTQSELRNYAIISSLEGYKCVFNCLDQPQRFMQIWSHHDSNRILYIHYHAKTTQLSHHNPVLNPPPD